MHNRGLTISITLLVATAGVTIAQQCWEDTSPNCCDMIENPPGTRQCTNGPCPDLPMDNPVISWVGPATNAGFKPQVISLPPEQCKYEARQCNSAGNCYTVLIKADTCYASKLHANAGRCP